MAARSNNSTIPGTSRLADQMFECIRCKVQAEERSMIDHIVQYHVPAGQAPWTCSVCHFQTITENKLRQHQYGREHTQAVKNNPRQKFFGLKCSRPYPIRAGVDYIAISDEATCSYWDPNINYRKRNRPSSDCYSKLRRISDWVDATNIDRGCYQSGKLSPTRRHEYEHRRRPHRCDITPQPLSGRRRKHDRTSPVTGEQARPQVSRVKDDKKRRVMKMSENEFTMETTGIGGNQTKPSKKRRIAEERSVTNDQPYLNSKPEIDPEKKRASHDCFYLNRKKDDKKIFRDEQIEDDSMLNTKDVIGNLKIINSNTVITDPSHAKMAATKCPKVNTKKERKVEEESDKVDLSVNDDKEYLTPETGKEEFQNITNVKENLTCEIAMLQSSSIKDVKENREGVTCMDKSLSMKCVKENREGVTDRKEAPSIKDFKENREGVTGIEDSPSVKDVKERGESVTGMEDSPSVKDVKERGESVTGMEDFQNVKDVKERGESVTGMEDSQGTKAAAMSNICHNLAPRDHEAKVPAVTSEDCPKDEHTDELVDEESKLSDDLENEDFACTMARVEGKLDRLIESLEPLKNIAKGLIAIDRHLRHVVPIMDFFMKIQRPEPKSEDNTPK